MTVEVLFGAPPGGAPAPGAARPGAEAEAEGASAFGEMLDAASGSPDDTAEASEASCAPAGAIGEDGEADEPVLADPASAEAPIDEALAAVAVESGAGSAWNAGGFEAGAQAADADDDIDGDTDDDSSASGAATQPMPVAAGQAPAPEVAADVVSVDVVPADVVPVVVSTVAAPRDSADEVERSSPRAGAASPKAAPATASAGTPVISTGSGARGVQDVPETAGPRGRAAVSADGGAPGTTESVPPDREVASPAGVSAAAVPVGAEGVSRLTTEAVPVAVHAAQQAAGNAVAGAEEPAPDQGTQVTPEMVTVARQAAPAVAVSQAPAAVAAQVPAADVASSTVEAPGDPQEVRPESDVRPAWGNAEPTPEVPEGSRSLAARLFARALERAVAPAAVSQQPTAEGESEPGFDQGGDRASLGQWLKDMLSRPAHGTQGPSSQATFEVPTLVLDGRAPGLQALAATAAAPGVPAQPVEGDVTAQMLASLRLQFRDGIGEAVLRLKPEHLGAVSISMRVENGGIRAHVMAEVPAVRQWLESQQDLLRSGLAEQGLRLDRFTVDPDGRREASPEEERRDDRQRRQRQPSRADREQAPMFEITV